MNENDSVRPARRGARWGLAALAAVIGVAGVSAVWADDDDDDPGGRRSRALVERPALVTEECGACHVVYPAGMLPAPSWENIMGNLSEHYGTDASLDDATAATITTWLTENAAPWWRAEQPPEDRITRSRWFRHEHDEIGAEIWRLESVRSAANCAACHAGAERGVFDEHDLVMPAGLTPRQQRMLRD